MSKQPRLTIPPKLRRGANSRDEWIYIDAGRDLLAYLCQALGLQDLAASRILDMGCGTKFTQAILNYDIAVGEYIGIDVYREMIDFLAAEVKDPRLSYHHVDTHNEMYNPQGKPLSDDTRLPVQEQSCDIICLFSVFTHLAPHDFHRMLKLMRRYIREDGRLLFTLYLNEVTGNGHGLVEQIAMEQGESWRPGDEPFLDAFPGKPLQWALYSRDHALELLAETGWEVQELCLPNALAQHHFICRPC